MVGPDGHVLDANDALARMLGYTREELTELAVAEFEFAPEGGGEAPPSSVRHTGFEAFETRLRRKDGTVVDVECCTTEVTAAECSVRFTVYRDRTEEESRRRVDERERHSLRSSEVLFRGAFDLSPVGTTMIAMDGTVVRSNPTILAMTGHDESEVVGKHFCSFIHPEDVPAVAQAFLRATQEGSRIEKAEFRIPQPQGGTVWGAATGAVIETVEGEPLLVAQVIDITQAKNAELAVKESEANLRAIIESTGDGILVLSAAQTLIHTNERFKEMWKVPGDLVERGDGPELLAHAASFAVEPERCLATATGLLASRAQVVDVFDTCDGRFIERRSSPLLFEERLAGRVWVFHDKTIQRTAELGLIESEERFRRLVESAPDGVFVQVEQRFVYANPAMAELLGAASVSDLAGSEVLARVHPDDRGSVAQRMESLYEGRSAAPFVEVRFLRCDGAPVPVEATAVPIMYQGRQGTLVFARDVSNRKHEDERRREFESRMQQAQRLESLGVLAGGIAHDFNNLLTGVLGHAELALQSLSPLAPAWEALEQVKVAARSAADLTRQMLAYAGKATMDVRPTHLNDLVRQMSQLLDATVSKRAVLRYRLTEPLPPVNADAAQLRQVVLNLAINASEALADSEGAIVISTEVVEYTSEALRESFAAGDAAGGRYVRLEVADSGCGMDSTTVERIFEPFFTTKFTGRGLGLPAVMGIVRSHRGALRVASSPGKGATFQVLLPAFLPDASPDSPRERTDVGWKGSGSVLVVDDEPGVRLVAKGMLQSAGFTVHTACDGEEAVELFERLGDGICLVILDMTMPNMDGEQTFRALRKLKPDARVILCSGYTEQHATSRFENAGLAGFLQKPYELTEFLGAVRAAIEDTK